MEFDFKPLSEKEVTLPWLIWAMYVTFSKIFENRSEIYFLHAQRNSERPRVFKSFSKIDFPAFWKLKIRVSMKFHATADSLKNVKCLFVYKK